MKNVNRVFVESAFYSIGISGIFFCLLLFASKNHENCTCRPLFQQTKEEEYYIEQMLM
jgi:hypothetical protein